MHHNTRHFSAIDDYIEKKITEQLIPGAVVLISSQGQTVHEAAYGVSQACYLDPKAFSASSQNYPAKIAGGIKPLATKPLMSTNQVFDLASLTKVLVTAFAIMLLLDTKTIALDHPLKCYLPEFNIEDKGDITIRQLIHHNAGFIPWIPLYYHADNPQDAISYIAQQPLFYSPGTRCLYSDLNFIILGYLIERITQSSLDSFIKKHLLYPLNLSNATFNPTLNQHHFAATSHGNPHEYNLVATNKFGSKNPEKVGLFTQWRDYTLVGEVNDGNAFHVFHGMAGHSGLFATAAEVNVLLELINNQGYFNNNSLISSNTINSLIHSCTLNYCLGWKIMNSEFNAMLAHTDIIKHKIIGHTGFTGTLVVCIPEKRFNLILLTNRQNLGLNSQGVYNDLTEFRKEVLRLALK